MRHGPLRLPALLLPLFASCGTRYGAPAEEGRARAAAIPSATAAVWPALPPLPEPVAHAPRAHDYDVEHYRISLTVDPVAERIEGEVSVRFRPLRAGFRSLELDAAELDVRSAVEEGGAELRWTHEGSVLRIELGRARPAGETVTVVVRYGGAPRRGMYFLGPDRERPDVPVQVYTQGEAEDTRYWVPCWDFPDDRATSEMLVTVPERLTTIAAGALLARERDEARGVRTDHWRMETPHASYLLTLVVGEHVIVEDRWRDVPLWYCVEKEDEARARPTFGRTPAILEFLSEWTGVPYPYAKYAQVCVREFMFGGMENISATTLTRSILHDDSVAEDASADDLVAHELAHQWFGDLVTSADWSHLWLHEGFASYFDLLWTERTKGTDEFRLAVRRSQEAYVETCRGVGRHPIVWNRWVDPIDLLDAHVYAGAAARLDLLRFVLGDTRFREAIGAWVRESRERCVTTEDFRRSIEATTGEDLRAFFDDWFYAPGYPEFRVRAWHDAAASAVVLSVEQVQRADGGTPEVFRTPVEIAVTDDAGNRTVVRVPIVARVQSIAIPVAGSPRIVRFDPGSRIPKSLEFEKTAAEWTAQLAEDPDPIGRLEAVEALGRLAERARGAALAVSGGAEESDADGPPSPLVAAGSAGALVGPLVGALARDPVAGVREAAARALGRVRGGEARSALVGALGDREGRVGRAACAALGAFEGDDTARGALRLVVDGEPRPHTVAEAMKAIGRVGGEGAFEILATHLDRPSHGDIVRAAALEGFGSLADPRALPALLEGASRRAPEAARRAATAALGRFAPGHASARGALERLIADPAHAVRRGAVEALAAVPDASVEGVLLSRLREEPDARVRAALAAGVRRQRRVALESGVADASLLVETARRRAVVAGLAAEEKAAEARAAAARAVAAEARARRVEAEAALEALGARTDR